MSEKRLDAETRMAAARQAMHWHLSRAAALCLAGVEFGGAIDRELTAAVQVRQQYDQAKSDFMEACNGTAGSGGDVEGA